MTWSPLTVEDVRPLAPAQQDALLDLFAAVALADGHLSDAEIDWLGQRVVLAVLGGTRRANERMRIALDRCPRDLAERSPFARAAVARLAAPELAERIVFALLQLGDSDFGHPAERALITGIAAAFRLDIDHLAALFERAAVHAIFPATARGDVGAVRGLLDAGTPVDARDHLGWTPLHVAVARGHHEIVGLLLERGAPVDAVHALGSTPIFCACHKPAPELVHLLLGAGANPNQIGKHGLVPLHLAALAGGADVAAVLIEAGAHVDLADGEGNTALHHAALEGHVDVVELLLARGAHVSATNASGQTAVHRAAAEDHAACVACLLDAGADPDAADATGTTPLHVAALARPAALAWLLERGADPDRRERSRGLAPLHLAAEAGLATCAAILVDAGAPIDAVTAREPYATALALARANRRLDAVDVLVAHGATTGNRPVPATPATVDARPWPGCARAPALGRDAALTLVRRGGLEALIWLSPARRGPVGLQDPDGRVWIAATSGPEGLAAFRHATPEIAWADGEITVLPRELAAMFAVAELHADGVVVDPYGPSPRLYTLEDCCTILQVAG